ncbi:hypothetical protein ACM6L3_15740 [Paenibacillus larvae]
MNKKNEQVLVESEFAPLKRVVLAQSQYGAPTEENLEKYKDYLPDSPEGYIYRKTIRERCSRSLSRIAKEVGS